jgi:thiol:disulfide interchange protein DsbC
LPIAVSIAVFLSLLLFASAAPANEAAIRNALEPRLRGAEIEAIAPSPIAGLWEVHYRASDGIQILYADAAGNHVIQGRIFDLFAEKDLTEERLRKLNAIRFDSLPLELAVKVQRGKGRHVLAMFTDPYCPACRQFERALAEIDDIAVYVFMYPVIRPENADHSRAVWCSRDRAKAWLELAAAERPKLPEAPPTCDNPVDKVVALGRRLGVNSTPTLYLANGERFSGGLRAADLRDVLEEVARAQRARK